MTSESPSLPFPLYCNREVHTTSAYFWDNSQRPISTQLVVQRTLSGRAFFELAGNRQDVHTGQAMLFTHVENSCYGFPEEAIEPYHTEFMCVIPGAGFKELFDTIRGEFGSIVSMIETGEASAWFGRIRDLMRSDESNRFRQAEACFRMLLALYQEQQSLREAEDPFVVVQRRIEDEFRHPIQIKQIAAEAGYSREHLIRSFRARTGQTPGAYLQRLRMQHAVQLLQTTRLEIADIARQSGYLNTGSFVRAFETCSGLPPSEFRRKEGASLSGSVS
jgi:AraC-like DNA-binding protein